MTPPSLAYMLLTPLVSMMMQSLKPAFSRIIRFTCSARCAALQWVMISRRPAALPTSEAANSAILLRAFLMPMVWLFWMISPLSAPMTGLMFRVEATRAFTPESLPFFRRVSRLSSTK